MAMQESSLLATGNRPGNSTTRLKPGQTLMAGGYDFAWCFVVFAEVRCYPHYLVGSNGTVWSERTRGGQIVPWTEMTPNKTREGTSGRLYVSFRKSKSKKIIYIHKIVCETFNGIRPVNKECCHNNGNPYDNRYCNLRWDTHLSNILDRETQGRTAKGSKNGEAKLSEDQVTEILRRYASKEMDQYELAEDFGVCQGTISRITRGDKWKHIVRPGNMPPPRKRRKAIKP